VNVSLNRIAWDHRYVEPPSIVPSVNITPEGFCWIALPKRWWVKPCFR